MSTEGDSSSSSENSATTTDSNPLATSTQQTDITDENDSRQKEESSKQHVLQNGNKAIEVKSVIPLERQKMLKWNGWGYNDSKFVLANESELTVYFIGNRYPIGNVPLPYFKQWVIDTFNLDFTVRHIPKPQPTNYPEPKICEEFLQDVKDANILYSDKGIDRLIRSHGQTLYEIHNLREGIMNRIPDLVVWPKSHSDVVKLVESATKRNVALIPFGGGTSVSGSVTCPQKENRCIVALDTSQMNKLLWLDRDNMVACFESGIIGQDLERILREYGLTVGHEPDSYEFSSLGGWVATRASGMKKNVYGNIEDLVVQVRMVTPKGVLERNCLAPRLSCGPDFNHVILGSEGTLGVVTEVVLKVSLLPKVKMYGSLIFPYFSLGVKCLREVAARKCQPSSIRLIDNDQFKFGQALKPKSSFFSALIEGMKKAYITKLKGFDLNKMCVATLVFEGDEVDVKRQQKLINEIADKYEGIPAGAVNGERGYVLTFVIAYIRDLALEYYIVAESFETSVPWSKCDQLCRNTKERVKKECEKLCISHYLISCRVTQTYDAGACVYFYFGYNYSNVESPVETYEHIEQAARDEILQNGGSISHHHGIGKLRSQWYKQSVSEVGVKLYKAAKVELDPKNIFAAGNLVKEEQGHQHNSLYSKL